MRLKKASQNGFFLVYQLSSETNGMAKMNPKAAKP